jgi:hypothetical protein
VKQKKEKKVLGEIFEYLVSSWRKTKAAPSARRHWRVRSRESRCVFVDAFSPMRFRRCVFADAFSSMRFRRCVFADAFSPMRFRQCVFADAFSPMRFHRCDFSFLLWFCCGFVVCGFCSCLEEQVDSIF